MEGFHTSSGSTPPQVILPADWSNLSICLKWTAGIGDALMAIGGTAKTLKEKPCRVTACVMEHQVPLINCLDHVDEVVTTKSLNGTGRNDFDVVLDFSYSLHNSREILPGCYYELIGKHIGIEVVPGSFTFGAAKQPTYKNQKAVFIHPGASNPNRRWREDCWQELSFEVRDLGYAVVWLGTSDEFGFNAESIYKLSDESNDLLWQVHKFADHAQYFIGNDSGFAHIAGLLGVKGSVLFFATEAKDVIGKYESLTGVDVYEKVGAGPTRSLSPDDLTSLRCIEALTVNAVLENAKIPIIKARKMDRQCEPPKRVLKVGLYGNTLQADNLANFLAQSHEVEVLDYSPLEHRNGKSFDVILVVSEESVVIRLECGVQAQVKSDHPEKVKRAIRELMGANAERYEGYDDDPTENKS